MLQWIDIINLCIASMGITVAAGGLLLTFNVHYLEKWVKKYFTIMFAIIVAYILSDLTSQISLVFLGKGFGTLSKIAVFFESFFSSLLMPFLTIYMHKLIGKNIFSKNFFVIMTLWAFYFITLLVTQVTTDIYYVTEDNVYKRGPYYPILLVPAAALMAVNLWYLYRIRNRISRNNLISLCLYILIPLVAMAVQMFSYGLLFVVFGISVSAMLLFSFIMRDQYEKSIRQAQVLSEQELMIKILQMRPHFIYNTLSNIYYLCDIEPEKAKMVVGDFITYLRKYFYAMTSKELIPFEEELIHTKAYLSVVKTRFEDMIFVEYDTDFIDFKVPPLTLEPIVENSVKHGLDPDSESLHILVRTRHEDGYNRLIVEDDGTGYSPDPENDYEKNDGEINGLHIGLSNVSERVRTMCGGSLTISKKNNGTGTIVTIDFPV